ncbi:protein involved in cellulose biosynthesis (CelD)-like protein [Paraburkholderia hospita]|uniref:Protein involved in cellulose biosynthesis (CelD)-like protein n=1 Tax=Paraburkholderia hospita TaxID=169430 RepID=A0ABN0FLP0_9BURK|nr:GNAT family N-acetyltransferase [Paraburkholderia hospita]EIM99621.1 protein involved in cellulose biosynthesis (CelD)-like protein [Paraburkholderia hospita]OUL87582.1 cellulose biosynthesis protein CelD [Paraburkholderia hospita]
MDIQLSTGASTADRVKEGRYAVNLLKNATSFEPFYAQWQQLQAESESCSPSLDYQYCKLAAKRVIAEGGLVAIVMVYDTTTLVALWPLSIRRKGLLRVASVLTCGNNEEYGGPLFKGRPTASVCVESIRAAMHAPADVLEIPFVEVGSQWWQALRTAPQSWVQNLLPERLSVLPGFSASLRDFSHWEDFLGTLSQSLRRNLRRYKDKLNASGNTEFGWCTNLDDATMVLHWLFANKRQWALERALRTSYLMDDRVRDFFIALAAKTSLETVPLVTFVKVDGVPICASINLVGPRTVEYWIFTYDEAYSRYSVGNLLTEFVARWAHANGRDFDMRPLYNEYKTYWVTRRTHHRTPTVMLTARGRLGEFALLLGQLSRVRRGLGRVAASALRSAKARAASQWRSRAR